jgi:hypothetical protein
MHPFGPRSWGPHDGGFGPGCSVRSTAVLQAHAVVTSAPGLAFSGGGGLQLWLRMWKQRASSRRAMATVAMLRPRRWASWA